MWITVRLWWTIYRCIREDINRNIYKYIVLNEYIFQKKKSLWGFPQANRFSEVSESCLPGHHSSQPGMTVCCHLRGRPSRSFGLTLIAVTTYIWPCCLTFQSYRSHRAPYRLSMWWYVYVTYTLVFRNNALIWSHSNNSCCKQTVHNKHKHT